MPDVKMQSVSEVSADLKKSRDDEAVRLMRWQEGKKRRCKCTNLPFATRKEFHRHHIDCHTTRVT